MLVAAELVACDTPIAAHAAAARAASPQYRLRVNTFTMVSSDGLMADNEGQPGLWTRSSLTLHRARGEAGSDVTLCDDQQYRGRHHGDGCRGHHCAPVGRIVAEVVVDPQRDRLYAGAVEDGQGEDEVPPTGQEREDRDGYDGRAGQWEHDDAERLPLRCTVDSRCIHQFVGQAEEERP